MQVVVIGAMLIDYDSVGPPLGIVNVVDGDGDCCDCGGDDDAINDYIKDGHDDKSDNDCYNAVDDGDGGDGDGGQVSGV